MQRVLRLALIGFGRSGRDIHARTLSFLRDRYEIVAGVEIDAQRRDMMRSELGCEVLDSYRQLFGRTDIDWVINCSYSHMHAPITKDLMEHGHNVLCEKPLARTSDEVQDLIDTQRRTGRRLAIFQQSRFSPAFERILRVIGSGVLGRIVEYRCSYSGFARRWDWQTLQEYNGGNLYNTGPHPVDQALRILDYEGMPGVTCFMDRANTFGDAEDYVKLLITAPGRPIVNVQISSCMAYPDPTYNVQGTRGGLSGSTEELAWRYYIEGEAPEQKLLKASLRDGQGRPLYCTEKLTWHEGSWKIPEDDANLFDAMGKSFYRMLYEATVTGGPLEITPAQVKQQIAVMEEAHRQNPLSRM